MTGGYNIIFAEKGQDADDDVKQFLSYGLAIHNLESNDLYDSTRIEKLDSMFPEKRK